MLNISSAEWMKILPVDTSRLNFDELRNFKKFHQLLTEKIEGPLGFSYFLKCFRFLQFFCITAIVENRFPALTNCWKDLESRFMSDPIFDDEVFIPSWIFFNFQINKDNRTILDEFELFLKNDKTKNDFQPFIDEMRKSRLGLYEEIQSTKKITKFRELITGNIISTIRSVPDYGKGEIFLARIVEFQGENFLFGDPKCWPQEYKTPIEGMVLNKLHYFNTGSTQRSYEEFMKKAGPYWFSCVASNQNSDILNPDHYLSYAFGPYFLGR